MLISVHVFLKNKHDIEANKEVEQYMLDSGICQNIIGGATQVYGDYTPWPTNFEDKLERLKTLAGVKKITVVVKE